MVKAIVSAIKKYSSKTCRIAQTVINELLCTLPRALRLAPLLLRYPHPLTQYPLELRKPASELPATATHIHGHERFRLWMTSSHVPSGFLSPPLKRRIC